jgi:glutamine amidotransferase
MSLALASATFSSIARGRRSLRVSEPFFWVGTIFIQTAYRGRPTGEHLWKGVTLKIGIIDYGSGNIGSVQNAFNLLGHDALLSKDFKELKSCSHLILPGVGSFSSTKQKLEMVLDESQVAELAESSKAFLGICVGMQLLCSSGNENGITKGYGYFTGQVDLIPGAQILPHMGWNNLEGMNIASPLLKGITEEDDFYFVHSYCLVGSQESQVISSAIYGTTFPAVVQNKNVYGVQFHPEKSSSAGRKLLENFLEL